MRVAVVRCLIAQAVGTKKKTSRVGVLHRRLGFRRSKRRGREKAGRASLIDNTQRVGKSTNYNACGSIRSGVTWRGRGGEDVRYCSSAHKY